MKDIKKYFKLVIPDNDNDDWDNTKKGKFFEDFVSALFRHRGWKTTERLSFTGMEIDILACDSDFNQEKIFIECKFSAKDDHNLSAGVITDLIGKAVIKDIKKVILISNQELSKGAKGIISDEEEKIKEGKNRLVYFSFWDSNKIVDIIMQSQGLQIPQFEDIHKQGSIINSVTLLKAGHDMVWVAEEIRDKGIPENAIIYPVSRGYNFTRVESIVKEIWTELNIVDGNPEKDNNQLSLTELNIVDGNPEKDNNQLNLNENISSIVIAKSFYEQRPCRSEDFVGRSQLQKNFWDILETIRDNQENTRVIGIKGGAGLGKSSLVVKLTDDSHNNQKYNKHFYIYNVDVRSAREDGLFVPSAIQKSIQSAIDCGFVNLPNHKIVIDSINNPLSSGSLKAVFNQLKADNKIIVIWFDQFENMLIQQSFLSIYRAFERLVYDVNAINENIVLGFSWRTGILIPDDNIAYRSWDSLKNDFRKELEELRKFSSDEVEEYIHKSYISDMKISTDDQQWISNNCEGYPWAMNKVFSFLINSKVNLQLGEKNINTLVKEMFTKEEEDIKNLGREYDCLKYVAEQSQVSSENLKSIFSEHIIRKLEEDKVLLKTGNNYVIYWDLFKDFILNPDSLPKIPVEYKFIYPIKIDMEVFDTLIKSKDKFNKYDTIAQNLQINKEKVRQIISDLKKVNFLHINSDGNIVVPEEIRSIPNDEDREKLLSNILAKKLKEHILLEKIYSKIQPQQEMTRDQFKKILKQAYPGLKEKTYEDYYSKMLPWFYFAGLLESRGDFIVRPKGEGRYKGKSWECGVNPPDVPRGQLKLEFDS